MLFPTHLIVGYLLARWWSLPAVWVVLGAALPDLIDKPLAIVGLLPLYHSIGHSVFFLIGLFIVIIGLDTRGLALWIGVASHLFLDALQMVINGRVADVQFLLWPVVHHHPAVQLGPIEFLFYYLWTPAFYLEIGIWILAMGVVIPDLVRNVNAARSP